MIMDAQAMADLFSKQVSPCEHSNLSIDRWELRHDDGIERLAWCYGCDEAVPFSKCDREALIETVHRYGECTDRCKEVGCQCPCLKEKG